MKKPQSSGGKAAPKRAAGADRKPRAGDKQAKPAVGQRAKAAAAAKPASKGTATRKRASARDTVGAEKPTGLLAPRPRDIERMKYSKEAALAAIAAAIEKKGLMPILLDVSEKTSYADFVGIVSGRSERQVEAIADNIMSTMRDQGYRSLGREGSGNGRWALLDFGEVVLHVFHHPVREVYDLEGLWIDAARVPLDVPPELRHLPPDSLYEVV